MSLVFKCVCMEERCYAAHSVNLGFLLPWLGLTVLCPLLLSGEKWRLLLV